MNGTNRLSGKFGIVLCSALLGYASHGQPSVSVGVSVPLPSVEVGLPSVQIHAESDFYEPLAPQGEWVVVGSYGRCWRPGHVARDWRPYCNGNWQRTDAGWYWVSDEPWAWATYHYGRWDFTDQYGWYWMPQTQWAPAWVSWHEGGGYVGWAPLQPSVSISVNGFVGFNESRIPPRGFVFVEQRQFLDPIRPTMAVVNNTTVISKTAIVANTRIVNNTVINEGPAAAVIEKASGRKVQAVPVQELRHNQEAAVVSKQRTPAATVETTVQPPIRGVSTPGEKRTVATPAPSPIQQPTAPAHEFAKPAPKGNDVPSETRKPALAAVESKPEAIPSGRSESFHPPVIKEPGQNANQQPVKQERAVQPSNRKEQQPVRQKPAPNEKAQPSPSDKGHENKPKD